MSAPSFIARRNEKGAWRILRLENGIEADLCGAASESVAWAQCAILNDKRGKSA